MSASKLRKSVSFAAAALVVLSAGLTLRADTLPVDVTYTVTGTPGAWLLDFTLTNNIPTTGNLVPFGVPPPGYWFPYLFGVSLPNGTIAGNPGVPGCPFNPVFCPTDFIWEPSTTLVQSNPPPGGSPFPVYNDLWGRTGEMNYLQSNIGTPYPAPGGSLSGFQVLDTDANAPVSVNWVTQAYNFYFPIGAEYTSGGNLNPDVPTNTPVFEGTATASTATPEPATFVSAAVAFVALLIWRLRRYDCVISSSSTATASQE
jgi:hypothetical protein